jgi:hypothetical protein
VQIFMSKSPDDLVITAGGPYPWIIINALASRFEVSKWRLRQPESKRLFLKRRAGKIGWLQTAGQFLTMVLSRFGKRFVRAREAEIIRSRA